MDLRTQYYTIKQFHRILSALETQFSNFVEFCRIFLEQINREAMKENRNQKWFQDQGQDQKYEKIKQSKSVNLYRLDNSNA
ncbi:hypothetical protein pb186bvf_017730 [Paramecium bursaria]